MYLIVLKMTDFNCHVCSPKNHQEFHVHVPKIEVLSLIRLFGGWVFPYISLTYSFIQVSTSILGT